MNEPKRNENSRPDPLKQIRRADWRKAFGHSDDEFHDRVRQTLFLIEEKEEEPVKKKLTFSMALAFALCLCLVAGAFAVALPKVEQPDLTNTPLSQGETDKPNPAPTATPRIKAESTPTPMPTYMPEIEYVWSAVGDDVYHSIRECFAARSGLTRVLLSVALNRQQSPCHYCTIPAYSNATPLPTLATIPPKSTDAPQTDTDVYHVYYTRDGVYYHTNPDCSGMRNATAGTIAEALSLNKTACTVCTIVYPTPMPTPAPLWDEEIVYVTDYNGRYFHFDQSCMNMSGAYYNTLTYAQENGFEPCPLCVWNMQESYLVENGVYFHVKEDCIPDGHAYECGYHNLKELLELGRTPCPMCYEPSSADIRYWQVDKDNFYHTSLVCTHTHMPVGSSDTLPNILEMLDHSFLIESTLLPCPDCVLSEPLVEQKLGIPSSDIPTFLDDPVQSVDSPKALVFTARGFENGQWGINNTLELDPKVQGTEQLTINSFVMALARGSLYLEVEFTVDTPDFLPASVRVVPYSEMDGVMEIKYADVREFTYENGETGYLLCQLTESPSDTYGADHFRIYAVENGFYKHIADFK